MKVTITIPTITASWVDGDTSETLDAIKGWDLMLDEAAPKSLGFIAGVHTNDGRLVAQVDLKGTTGKYQWWIFGMADDLYEDKEGYCETLEEAQGEVLKRLGGMAVPQ